MREKRLFWDAEGRRRSRNPYQKSTVPWLDEKGTHQFLLDYILRSRPQQWRHALVELGIVSPEHLERLRSRKCP